MSQVTYPVDAATLAQGSCPSTYQELADLLATIYSVTVDTNNTGIYVSATKPGDTTLVWKQLDSSGNPVRDYVFVGGLWLSRHTLETGSVIMWKGDITTIDTFDGGAAGAVSLYSGPMWQIATGMAARFPIAPGTLPSATVLASGDTGGEEKHVLTSAEGGMDPAHTHTTGKIFDFSGGGAYLLFGGVDSAGLAGGLYGDNVAPPDAILNTITGDLTGTSGVNSPATIVGHNNLPPYYAINFIERTARQYFAVP